MVSDIKKLIKIKWIDTVLFVITMLYYNSLNSASMIKPPFTILGNNFMSNTDFPKSIELFLFAICPFAQRVHMSLVHSQLPFEKIILDPSNIPEDFTSISPLGNVPILRVNNSESIFESTVINDYIAQVSSIKMEPESQIQRAQMRAWSEYSGTCMGTMMQVLNAEDEVSFKQMNKTLIEKLLPLSRQLKTKGPFFYGDVYTTIDSTYAPLFFRMKTLSELYEPFSIAELPDNIKNWMDALLNSYALKKSIIGDFPSMYRKFISKQAAGKYIDKQLQ
jgi:glutathione S-transferase